MCVDFVVFLDFDGVLHPMRGTLQAEDVQQFTSVPHLWQLLRTHPGVRVVFSTSWRFHYSLNALRELVTCDGNNDLGCRFIGMTPKLILKEKEEKRGIRQRECEAWLAENGMSAVPWLAIDDFASFFDEGCPNFYLVDAATGLTAQDVTAISARILDL